MREISEDMEALGQSEEDVRFFLSFAHEVMDRNGRFLCFVDPHIAEGGEEEERPPSYNERLLREGRVNPLFIWPNIGPFRRMGSLIFGYPGS